LISKKWLKSGRPALGINFDRYRNGHLFLSRDEPGSDVKVTFFRGTSLRPVPPGGTGKDARWIDVHEDDLDEAQMATWVKQAAALPGWVTSDIQQA
jgi:hypothetical protein